MSSGREEESPGKLQQPPASHPIPRGGPASEPDYSSNGQPSTTSTPSIAVAGALPLTEAGQAALTAQPLLPAGGGSSSDAAVLPQQPPMQGALADHHRAGPASLEIEEDGREETPHQPLLGSRGGRGVYASSSAGPPAADGKHWAGKGAGGSGSTAGGIPVSAAAQPPDGEGSRGPCAPLEVESGEDGHSYQHSAGTGGRPLKRFVMWVLSFTLPGLGMFSEAYFVFSVGNLRGIFTAAYPECWQEHTTCSQDLVHTLTYSQVAGIIAGQLGIGFIADRLGRKLGSVMTASFMLLFGILVASSTGRTSGELFLMFTICQALFGVGVGGEYPVASTSASERAEQTQHLQGRRGETVVLTFSMQGWGNLINTLVLVALMAAFRQTQPPYNQDSLAAVWRLSYVVGLLPVGFMFVWRVWFLRESELWKKGRQAAKEQGGGKDSMRKTRLLWKHYWHRILGTSLSWFWWDVCFYGNKLFQSTFIAVINPGATLIQALQWTLLNSAVALVGYYFAAFTVDKPWMGRKRMQAWGFAWMSILFLACAAFYRGLVGKGIHVFQFLYYFTSFWGQFGPNATTWLLPAELVPTEMRSGCHGFASAVGKAGALLAGVVFALVDDRTKFWISAFCGFVGVFLTLAFIPDITTLDLQEGDTRWQAILDGRSQEYSGEAVAPQHLSYVERLLRYGDSYRPSEAVPAMEPL